MNFDQMMETAFQHHNSGRFAQAETLYRQALVDQPDHAQVLNLLGVVCSQQGRKDEAVKHLLRSISLMPAMGSFHGNLAVIYIETGKIEAAVASARQALALQKDHPDALNVLGAGVKLSGNLEEAAGYFERAVAARPGFIDALSNLGDTYNKLGRPAEANGVYQRLLALRPDHPGARNNRGEALLNQDRIAEAIDVFRALIASFPDSWEGYNNLGVALTRQGRFEEAIPVYEKTIALEPTHPGPYNNLGNALTTIGRPDEGIAAIKKALSLRPDIADAYNNLGNARLAKHELEQATKDYDTAIYLAPNRPDAHWNKSLLLLLEGDFARGFVEYEWRWPHFPAQQRHFHQPLWNGYDIKGKTILLHAEQGFGDTIQFIRYAPLVAGRGANVIVECQGDLFPLLQGFPGTAAVLGRTGALPHFDVHCPLLSLPHVMERVPPDVPADVPYISVPQSIAEKWGRLVAPYAETLKVGLTRAGAAGHGRDRDRSAPPETFAPLAAVEGVTFFNLQKPAGGPVAPPAGLNWVDFSDHFSDFAQTAALISNLDLVISVDTAVAHLAGALGKPVWMMLAYVPDWRWMLNRQDTPWYPTMRLFRQPQARDWESVMKDIVAALRMRLTENRT